MPGKKWKEHLAYPTFDILSDYNEPSMDFYTGWDSGCLTPSRNWCYMADIIMDGVHIRPSAIVMDSAGEEHLVCFYLDDAKSGDTIAEAMKPGYTLALLFAERKTFMDLQEGIRVEDTTSAKVFKAPLEEVMAEIKRMRQPKSCCFGCGSHTNPETPLKRCAACHIANYCSRECQLKHWKSGHKGLCPDMSILRSLDEYLHEPFRKFKSFDELTA